MEKIILYRRDLLAIGWQSTDLSGISPIVGGKGPFSTRFKVDGIPLIVHEVGICILALSASFAGAEESKIVKTATPFSGSVLYSPNDHKAHPGIIILHGSEGGSLPYIQLEAQYLAAHGYVVLAYCWYNCGKNPINSAYSPLENVELRNTIKAITWLRNSSGVQSKQVALLGTSRGAEQTLLLATLPEVITLLNAVAVHTPSDTIVSGFNWGSTDRRCWICATPDIACFNNSDDLSKWDWKNVRPNPACGQLKDPKTMNAWLLDGTSFKIDSTIEIEKFKKPVFVTVGDKDDMWDYHKSTRVADRLKKYGQSVELHVFPGERHVFSPEGENKRHEMLLKFLRSSFQ